MREWFSYLSPKQQTIKILLTYAASIIVLFAITNHFWSLYDVAQSMYPLLTIGVALMISTCHYNKKVIYKLLLVLFSIVPLVPVFPLMMLGLAFSWDNPYAGALSHLRLVLIAWLAILTPLIAPLVLSFFDWKRLLIKLHISKAKA